MIRFPSFNPRELKAILFLLTIVIIGGVITLYKSKNPSFAPELILNNSSDSATYYDSTKKRPSIKQPLNINLASEKQLQTLPGIGPVLSKRIIEQREKKGGFKSTQELKEVSGIGDKKFERLKNLVTVN